MGDIDVDTFLETLKQLIMSSTVELIKKEKHQLESLEEEVKYMREFLKYTEKKRNEHSEVMNLVRRIKDVICEAENIVELYVVQAVKADHVPYFRHQHLGLESVKREIKTLIAKVKQFYRVAACKNSVHSFFRCEGIDMCFEYLAGTLGKLADLFHLCPRPPPPQSNGLRTEGSSLSGGSNISKVAEEKVVVGFKEEVEKLMGKLIDTGDGGQPEIISIVGAAGGGKTTLAKEVYDHPLMAHTFQFRAWVTVSQDYNRSLKRNLLIRILKLASPKKHGDYKKSTEDKLAEYTLKCLRGKKYLIVMDDMWSIEAWNDIQRSLPRECNGSKLLFTCRELVEPNGIGCIPHRLAPLSKSCSWGLLQKKVFGKRCCPPELVDIGKRIAEKCEGLPLEIVAIAGILTVKDKTLNMWEEISSRVSSIIAKNQDDCMAILELSYNNLPLHLKACFVYLGGFPKDSEILVRELIWLWIAEGFIQQREGFKSLEDVAKYYLSNLIDRSLVMVTRKRTFGGIKACRIHDLLRELCLRKAKEDNFLGQIYGDDTSSPSVATKLRRLFISRQFFREFSLKPDPKYLRSFMCLVLQNSTNLSSETNLSVLVENFELLRVLSFLSAECQEKIEHLVHLRYLALKLPNNTSDRESPFSYLFNLETLYLQARSYDLVWETIPLPRDIYKMVKLRHLHAKRGVFKYHLSRLYPDVAAGIGFDRSSKLDSLQTLHSICPCEECRNFLVRTLNLRKLGYRGDLISNDFSLMLPDLEFLKCLETLTFNQSRSPKMETTLPRVLKLPPTVTRLTLKHTCLKWEELSVLQTMPNLEVLKLSRWACRGLNWSTLELDQEGFSRLKYLRLQDLDIEEWNASEDLFPNLEVLVIRRCAYLEEIPFDFANLNQLREIEVRRSRRCVEESATKILEKRRDTTGDDNCINLLASSNY